MPEILDIQPIKARLAAATPGPWKACRSYFGGDVGVRAPGHSEGVIAEFWEECLRAGEKRPELARANGELAAHARTDLEALVAEVERLRARYETPGVACNNGHVSPFPVSLWCCPDCTDALRVDAARFRFLRDNPLGLRAVDGNAGANFAGPCPMLGEYTDYAMDTTAAPGAAEPTEVASHG